MDPVNNHYSFAGVKVSSLEINTISVTISSKFKHEIGDDIGIRLLFTNEVSHDGEFMMRSIIHGWSYLIDNISNGGIFAYEVMDMIKRESDGRFYVIPIRIENNITNSPSIFVSQDVPDVVRTIIYNMPMQFHLKKDGSYK